MKPGDLSLHLEAYLALKKALGFLLARAKGCCATSWHSPKATASASGEQSVPKSPLIGLVRYPTVAGSVEKWRV